MIYKNKKWARRDNSLPGPNYGSLIFNCSGGAYQGLPIPILTVCHLLQQSSRQTE